MIRNEREYKKNILSAFLILFIIFVPYLTSNAQLPFYNPFYYPISYFPPYPYTFFSAYYSAPALPFYNTGYFTPLPITPVSLTSPTISPAPTASISGIINIIPAPVTTILGVIIADFLINTGNPQVDAVLSLIATNPALLDNPLLLNSLINTGNPDVAAALAWLSTAI